MTYFTVYYGNNESMMFNAECTTGSLINRMIELLSPHTVGYTRLELVPINFVLEHFKPPPSLTTRSGQASHEHAADLFTASPSTVQSSAKAAPFTGTIPFVGIATRAVESYADAVLGGVGGAGGTTATTAAGIQPSTSSSSPSASGCGVSTSAANYTHSLSSMGPTVPSSALQNSYVLLGCRYHHHHLQQQQEMDQPTRATAALLSTAGGSGNNNNNNNTGRAAYTVPRGLCGPSAVWGPPQAASLLRAQIIAAAPIVPSTNSRGNIPTSAAANRSTTAQPPAGSIPNMDPGLLLLYNNGLSLTGPSAAVWRKNFAQYLTTLLLTPAADGPTASATPSRAASPLDNEHNRPPSDKQNNGSIEPTQTETTMLLPPMATGLFQTPTPPITAYDVLWRGARGEHVRLQDALDERVVTDTDIKKPKKKRN